MPTLDLTAVVSIYPAGQAGNEAQLLARCQVTPVPLPSLPRARSSMTRMVDDFAVGPGGIWLSGRATMVSDQAGVTAKKCTKKRAKKRAGLRRCAKKRQE